MPRQNAFLFSLFMSMAVLSSVPVSAQTPPVAKSNFEQFPTFVQFTSADKDGSQTILRCGYSASVNKAVILDPEFHEVSTSNPLQHTYSRLQHVGDVIIATFMPPNGQGLVVELVKADGSLLTKNCKSEMNNDTISNCSAGQPVATAAEIRDEDQKITPQCSDLLQQRMSLINLELANPQLAPSFKASFAQKIRTLEAP